MNKFKVFFEALLESVQKNTGVRQIAKNLALNALYEREGRDALFPEVRHLFGRLERNMEAKGKPIFLVNTGAFRTAKEQDDLYAKGRSKPGTRVTNARGLESYHNYGLAFDVAFMRYRWNPPSNDWWYELGKEGEKLGLTWGGDFGDFGHFEWVLDETVHWKKLKKYFQQ